MSQLALKMIGTQLHKRQIKLLTSTLHDVANKRSLIQKIACAQKLTDFFKRRNKETLSRRFQHYLNSIKDRKRNLLKKYVIMWMNKTPINYQPAFWRWMFIVTDSKYDWSHLFPHHWTMMKRLVHLIK